MLSHSRAGHFNKKYFKSCNIRTCSRASVVRLAKPGISGLGPKITLSSRRT
uniref:Uncharacterized protein n=1 Tax=Arundo donax TaxID=35708 RepID=A0A0A9AUD4_ARUDO